MKLKDRAHRIKLNARKWVIEIFWPGYRTMMLQHERRKILDIEFAIEMVERNAWMRGFKAGQKDAWAGRIRAIDTLSGTG